MRARSLLTLGLLLVNLEAAPAQVPVARLSDEATISLVTILPGEAIYSSWGHTALRVHDPAAGLDATYNYGTFDFQDPLFLPRFVDGRLDYFLSVQSYPATLRLSREFERRSVIEQELALTPAERDAVFDFLQANALPENRGYRYQFLFDNCSTRPRDVLQQVLGDRLRFGDTPDPGLTFRQLIDHYIHDRTFLDLGVDLLLGTPTDRRATPRETMFLPEYLMVAFDHATVADSAGVRPLVARTDTVVWFPPSEAPVRPWAAWTGWALLALSAVLTVRRMRAGRPPRRWPDVALLSVAGVAGLLIVFLWFVSEHTVTGPNLHLFWLWPTHVVAAVALGRRPGARWLTPYLGAAAVATLGLVAGWFVWPQDFPAAALPFMLLVAARCARQAAALRIRKQSVELS